MPNLRSSVITIVETDDPGRFEVRLVVSDRDAETREIGSRYRLGFVIPDVPSDSPNWLREVLEALVVFQG